MKKILFMLILCFTFVNVKAQVWYITEKDADELTGMEAYTEIMFVRDDSYFFIFNKDNGIGIKTLYGIFDYRRLELSKINVVEVLIGYYIDNKLYEKETTTFICDEKYDLAFSRDKTSLKIINHLKTKGNVRFVIKRFNRSNLDITVLMNKNIPFTINNAF